MQGSTPRTRNTLPASAARNLAGTVSRFLASSECSKVPWKAKAHVSGSWRRVQSIRGGGVGGAPPPRTGFASATYPTPSHSATQMSTFVPRDLNPVTSRTSIWLISRPFILGSRWADPRGVGARADAVGVRGRGRGLRLRARRRTLARRARRVLGRGDQREGQLRRAPARGDGLRRGA